MEFSKDCINIVDEKVPSNTLMSAHYKQSFAYYTIRDRLPIILTQVVDNLSKEREEIVACYGEEAREELKNILNSISQLKYELQTDKNFSYIVGNGADLDLWNIFISSLEYGKRSYFTACWLYAECYIYRRLKSIFDAEKNCKDFDYFRKQKQNALTCCQESLISVTSSYMQEKKTDLKSFFYKLIQLNLWGNRCDLSISEGREIRQTGNLFNKIDVLKNNILIDKSLEIWNCISSVKGGDVIIDFINDNSGYELFTDLMVAVFLVEQKFAKKIRFHVKAIPWYISDVTPYDFRWTIEYLCKHESILLRNFGETMTVYLKEGTFELCEPDIFWTAPYEFYRMDDIKRDLYNKLSEAHLLIFKGDLNYRKLLGDFTWDYTQEFETCLRGFRPSNLCTLRTVKADLICGLKSGVAESISLKNPTWMTTGEYGVIQFARKKQ